MGQVGSASPLLVFASEQCTTGLPLPKGTEAATAGSPLQHRCQESLEDASVLTWRRTCKDPFVGQWEQILSWMQADPTRTSGDILRELQALFPGRYHPQQVRTLQRGMRKIRAHLLTTREEQWQQELIPTVQFQRQEPTAQQSSSSFLPIQPADSSLGTPCTSSCPPHPSAETPHCVTRDLTHG
jgi:hypothetical protein